MDWEKYLTAEQFYNNFVADDRFVKYILGGLKTTLIITLFAVLLGIFLGFLVGTVRSTYEMYFFIFAAPGSSKLLSAILAFGINSGAYVAEIFRSGIMSIDNGQFEAGRSLGFNYAQTVWYIILPQAFKNVLPALCNEFIALLKETSVSGFIALQDLTRGADVIRSRTYNPVLPLFTVALVYWMIVTFLTYMVGKLETRLRKNEKR